MEYALDASLKNASKAYKNLWNKSRIKKSIQKNNLLGLGPTSFFLAYFFSYKYGVQKDWCIRCVFEKYIQYIYDTFTLIKIWANYAKMKHSGFKHTDWKSSSRSIWAHGMDSSPLVRPRWDKKKLWWSDFFFWALALILANWPSVLSTGWRSW